MSYLAPVLDIDLKLSPGTRWELSHRTREPLDEAPESGVVPDDQRHFCGLFDFLHDGQKLQNASLVDRFGVGDSAGKPARRGHLIGGHPCPLCGGTDNRIRHQIFLGQQLPDALRVAHSSLGESPLKVRLAGRVMFGLAVTKYDERFHEPPFQSAPEVVE